MTLRTLLFKPLQIVANHFFMISVVAVIYFGWQLRADNYITAENGIGYWLGIVGGSLMLVLLLYPVSKRVKLLIKLMPSRYWFGVHMTLGIIGPTMILFHSNFQLGSTNSSVALICMLLVAGSGVVGRYIYTHIHHGLYGSRITIKELQEKTEDNHSELLSLYGKGEQLNNDLKKMEEKVLRPYAGLMTSLSHVIYLGLNSYGLKMKVMRLVSSNDVEISDQGEAVIHESNINKISSSVSRYTLALRELAAHRVYERLFSLWHVFHLPLFYMMIITSVIHIVSVHIY